MGGLDRREMAELDRLLRKLGMAAAQADAALVNETSAS
jgi:hypothetical protein